MATKTSKKRETKICLIQPDPSGSDGNFLGQIIQSKWAGLSGAVQKVAHEVLSRISRKQGRIIRGILDVEVLI